MGNNPKTFEAGTVLWLAGGLAALSFTALGVAHRY
jgi:hypothetical protein